ncbi:hypothetical protein D3C87_170920 [compost metagenome]
MKKSILIAVLLLFQMVSAQDITKEIGDFNAVRIFDKIDALLVKGSENKIVIKGSRAQEVEVVNKNGELKVRMKLTKLLKGDDVSVTIYYKAIDRVEASEGARVSSQDTFKSMAFELNAKEGSEIKLKLDVQKLKSKANSGGILNITGTAVNHDILITSGGILKGRDLDTKQTAITVNAGGEADITASDLVDAKTRAGGDINIYGNPAQVNQKTTAGGSINVK